MRPSGKHGKPQIALLIDADNSPASQIDLILNELSTFDVTNVRRAYGNWKNKSPRVGPVLARSASKSPTRPRLIRAITATRRCPSCL